MSWHFALATREVPVIKVIDCSLPHQYSPIQKDENDMGTAAAEITKLQQERKKLVRRSAADDSQRIRRAVQWLFVALNGWLGVQFFLWVRYFERGGEGLNVPRPAGAEGWLPIAGLMNTKYLLLDRKSVV